MTIHRVKLPAFFLLFFLLLHGCGGLYSVVEFEVLEPATVSFPEHVNQLIFLNRAPISLDIWDTANQEGMNARALILLDTLIVNNMNRGILAVLRGSPIERFHRPIWLTDRRSDTSNLDDRILTRREVDNICDTIGGDAIISLEYYSAGLKQHIDYYKNEPDVIQNHYFYVFNKVKLNIHHPGFPRPYDSYQRLDTLYFPVMENGAFLNSVPAIDMIRDLFYETGFKFGTYLVPVWNSASRLLYRGKGDSLKQAAKYTDKGDWDQAFSIWKELSHSADSTQASRALNNMAIYYELEDQLDSASIMLERALVLDSVDIVESYREELEVRMLNRKDIYEQVKQGED